MIILDTNVISEAIRVNANPAVNGWLNRQVRSTLYLTATVLSELLYGLEILPKGRRRTLLSSAISGEMQASFAGRTLSFDAAAAAAFATIVARGRAKGQTIAVADGQIAAVAAVHGFAVATRDLAPFRAAGVEVIDPWASGTT